MREDKLIIKGREITGNDWTVLRAAEGEDAAALAVPAGKTIVPLATWQAQAGALAARRAAGDIGVWFAPDERPETLKGELDAFAVVAVDFPKFTDGRGYSIAYNLRTRLGYAGELRAIGDVLRDQLFSMQRVGFNAYDVRGDRSIEDALKGLSDFSETYQASVDQKVPLFRRAARPAPSETGDAGYGI
jgi:uncharacterized protein (DUF934 family)